MEKERISSVLVKHIREPFYAALLVVYIILALVYFLSSVDEIFIISASIYPLIALIPVLLYFLSAKKVGFSWRDKFSVLVVFNALAAIFWLIAEIIWCYYYNLALGVEEPYPSEADPFYIMASIFAIIGIAVYINNLYQDMKGTVGRREIMMSTIFTVILTVIVIVLLSYPITTYAAEEEPLILCLDITYIVLDIIMAILIFVGILLIKGRIGKVLFLFLMSCLLVIMFDVAFAYLDLMELYYDGHPIELLDIASYFLDTAAFYEIYKLYK